jgi:uncharacterized protein (UPF0264 family)
MTSLLASVRSSAEAKVAVLGGADIIDAKEPRRGALGSVAPHVLTAIVRAVGGQQPVSATIGDMPLDPEGVRAAALATSRAGADIVKIGIFEGDLERTFAALRPLAREGRRFVAVVFADRAPDLTRLVSLCAEAGFFGVMLDTADKTVGPLTAHLDATTLRAFVDHARRRGLQSGLAGSLQVADIPLLASLHPDYLGFRSALTSSRRTGRLDPEALRIVRAAMDAAAACAGTVAQPLWPSRSATATAGAASAAAPAATGSASTTVSKPR